MIGGSSATPLSPALQRSSLPPLPLCPPVYTDTFSRKGVWEDTRASAPRGSVGDRCRRARHRARHCPPSLAGCSRARDTFSPFSCQMLVMFPVLAAVAIARAEPPRAHLRRPSRAWPGARAVWVPGSTFFIPTIPSWKNVPADAPSESALSRSLAGT